MNEYVAPIKGYLTPVQIEIVERIDVLLPRIAGEYHLGELALINWDIVEDVPQQLMEIYQYWLDRESGKYVLFSDEVGLYDEVRLMEVVADLMLGELSDLIEEYVDADEDEFLSLIMAEVTVESAIYWEDKATLTPDNYARITADLRNEKDDSDELHVVAGIRDKAVALFGSIENSEDMAMYKLTVVSSTLPIDFDNALKVLSAADAEGMDKDILVNEVKALEVVTDASNRHPEWRENVTNVFGYFPSDVPVPDDRF